MRTLSADLGLHHTYVPHDSTFDEFGVWIDTDWASCLVIRRDLSALRRSRSRMIMMCSRQYKIRRGVVSFFGLLF